MYQDFLSVRNLHKNRKFVIKILISVINTVFGKYWRSINPQREFIRILSDQKRLSDLAKNLLSSKQQGILFTTSENRKKFGQAIGKDEIASILLLHWLLNGIPTNKFDHIVIDEAQDLSSLHFILLKR